ncbi:hypothetical protein [Marinitenerispora sediminis]|uniref:Uncharacterized protein n=1 Tax=Marinitenerispora sediminis TaxID=1931232 RepID=A0A368T291_9ACTN|nr:hypothetical protein [Marinitenerispora sediminis]RCV55495.1 hypothetical protein DEF24_17830 [Marinitenerispora sediminis]RCV57607.1 hypothetical protein DEF28_01440 [Marinitenerispora sediminis]RCV59646.1 hypothetical protein DEF23_06620 [Marinitenerispora sediminis]
MTRSAGPAPDLRPDALYLDQLGYRRIRALFRASLYALAQYPQGRGDIEETLRRVAVVVRVRPTGAERLADFPRPDLAADVVGFRDLLRQLRLAAGEPAFAALARRPPVGSASTMWNVAAGSGTPTWPATRKFVRGCLEEAGINPGSSEGEAYLYDWECAWRRIRSQRTGRPAESPPPAG